VGGVFAIAESRGLAGVQLVISDAHSGLRAAIEAILIGASWQRCRVGPGALCFSLRPHLGAQDGGLLIDRLGAVTGALLPNRLRLRYAEPVALGRRERSCRCARRA
jgi:hypothetical protein